LSAAAVVVAAGAVLAAAGVEGAAGAVASGLPQAASTAAAQIARETVRCFIDVVEETENSREFYAAGLKRNLVTSSPELIFRKSCAGALKDDSLVKTD
jgi:hypothetical protein